MEKRTKYRYSLTVNAFSEEEIAEVEKKLKSDRKAREKLCLDRSYGPCASDGSFLAIFSSDSFTKDGLVQPWGQKAYYAFFAELTKALPGIRCTLRGTDDAGEKIRGKTVWGATRKCT